MPSGEARGGAEEALSQVVERLHLLHFELVVLFTESGALSAQFASLGVRALEFPAGRLRDLGRFVSTVLFIRSLIRENACSGVIGWMTKGHIYGGLAAWLEKVPAICFQMGLPDKGWVDRVSKWLPAVETFTCSEFAAREQRKVSRGPVRSIPLGMDEGRFSPADLQTPAGVKARLGFEPARPLVGIVGRLQRWKGIDLFLEAMALVLSTYPDAQGVVVGGPHGLEPDYPAFLERETRRLGLTNTVRLAGQQQNVQEWMQAMDVVVHASEREPFGIVVVEAMALGKAVIASIPGGPEEILIDEVHGLLVPSNDSVALVRAITRFLADPKLSSRCGAAARARAQDYTATRFVQRFASAVKSLLETSAEAGAKPSSDLP